MKKVSKSEGRGEFIPKKGRKAVSQANSGSMGQQKNTDRLGNVMDSLSKLDPAQLVQLSSSVANAFNAHADLSKEREKTRQVEIQAELGLAEIKAKTKDSKLQYKKSIKSLQTEDKKDQRRHKEVMGNIQKLSDKQSEQHSEVMRLLDMVEKGDIPAEMLAQLIHEAKAKS